MVDFAVERLVDARACEESARLLALQWQETGDREIDSNPNWALYEQLEERNALMLTVARRDGTAVGFMLGLIYPHPNAVQESIASIPTFFVVEGPLRALTLSRMLDFTLERLADRRVFRVDIETNAEHSAGRLWELKGFKVAKIGYSMHLKKPAGARYA